MDRDNDFRLNTAAFGVVGLKDDDSEDRGYWLLKSPTERLIALEYLRQVMYGYDPNTTRLQRVFEVVKFP